MVLITIPLKQMTQVHLGPLEWMLNESASVWSHIRSFLGNCTVEPVTKRSFWPTSAISVQLYKRLHLSDKGNYITSQTHERVRLEERRRESFALTQAAFNFRKPIKKEDEESASAPRKMWGNSLSAVGVEGQWNMRVIVELTIYIELNDFRCLDGISVDIGLAVLISKRQTNSPYHVFF